MTRAAAVADASLVLFAAPASIANGLSGLEEAADVRAISSVADVGSPRSAAVVLLSEELAGDLSELPEHVVILSVDDVSTHTAESAQRLFLALGDLPGASARLRAVRAAARHSASLLGAGIAKEHLQERRTEVTELNRIGMALMSEHDPDRLLGLILTQARRLTTSDAGSLYLVEGAADGSQRLHFLRTQNDSLPDLESPDFTLALDETSIAGYAASTGKPVVIDDVYEMPDDLPITFNKEAYDEKYGYRAKSMLVVPMMDHKGQVVGVLQLLNRKRDPSAAIRTEEDAERWVLPYGERSVELVSSMAGRCMICSNHPASADRPLRHSSVGCRQSA